jgi:hypothetical protein
MGSPSHDPFLPQIYEPLSVRGSAVDARTAHALEAIASALCRIDMRLAAADAAIPGKALASAL